MAGSTPAIRPLLRLLMVQLDYVEGPPGGLKA